MNKAHGFLLLVSTFIISACSNQIQLQVTPTSTATTTASLPTSTRTTPKPTTSLTATVKPVTRTPTSTPRATATGTQILPTPDGSLRSYASPDGKWIAKVFSGTGSDTTPASYTKITSVDGVYEWTLGYDDKYRQQYLSQEGFLWPYHWSKDGRYLYIAIEPQFDGPLYFSDGAGLQRLDLQTGRVTDAISGAEFTFYAFSFSPNDASLAYVLEWNTPLKLIIRNLATGEERWTRLPEEYPQAGDIVWSPDGQKVILGVVVGDVDREEFAVMQVDLRDLSQSIFAGSDKRLFRPQEWLNDNQVLLADLDGNLWILDTSTTQITIQSTATPYP